MELQFNITLSATNLPKETYSKIRKVIKWQIENNFNEPFEIPAFEEIMSSGQLAPSFLYFEFGHHNNQNYTYYNTMALILKREFGFSNNELRAFDLLLNFASIEYNKIEANMGICHTAFTENCCVRIIITHDNDIPSIPGLTYYW
ncbi:MAG: hypothetical protein RBR82_02795 [Pseudomonas sp.]|nr:hypothetical protein [Pseudomonas sp.]